MKPVNNKSLLHFIFDQMEKLDKGEISPEIGLVQSKLASQANNSLSYELKRADIQMKLTAHNAVYKDGLRLREAEGKNFEEE
jgi:hypothetical protein